MVEEAVDDFYAESGEAAFLAGAAKDCRNCSRCGDVPCGACQAGGVCDAFECLCDRDDERDERDDESEEDDG